MTLGDTLDRDRPVVRAAKSADLERVLEVERRAFGGDIEAELVRALVYDGEAFIVGLSLVAEEAGTVVGHVLFTRASCGGGVSAVLLAPLAVVPERQQRGVGTLLVREGLEQARALGFGLVLVLGDPAYYTRFGFGPAAAHGITPPYPVDPADAWMVLELQPGVLAEAVGVVGLAEAFRDPALWRE